MANSVALSDKLISEARSAAKGQNRSLSAQIEHWAKIGKIAEDNPDLTYEFIRDILIGVQESEAGYLAPYEFG